MLHAGRHPAGEWVVNGLGIQRQAPYIGAGGFRVSHPAGDAQNFANMLTKPSMHHEL